MVQESRVAIANIGSSSNKPLQATPKTGLATTIAADDTSRMLAYYQDSEGRIIENSYINRKWTLQDQKTIDEAVVTKEATLGSPLAAISYMNNGKAWRQVFFITAGGLIKSTMSSETSDGIAKSWSNPTKITTNRSKPAAIGLAACTTSDMNGISVFYPSQYNQIEQARFNFTNGHWHDGWAFEDTDALSGVACATHDGYLNVYFRNTTTGAVKQVYDYYLNDYIYWHYHGITF